MPRKLFATGLALIGLLGLVQMAAAGPFGLFGNDDCADKVCKPVVETKKVVKRVYDDKCIDFCEPKCPMFSLFGSDCCDGSCGPDHACGNVHTRKVLVVKLRSHEECVNKCVVEQNCPAACAAPCSAPCAAPCTAPAPQILQPAGQSSGAPMPVTMPAVR